MAPAAPLSNYQLGDLLGRGASGSVYRALNFLTGETVAIKSVSLHSLAPSSLPDLMSEIDLLKNLNHSNIVKYKEHAQDKDNLFIVMEYCENGSLQTILKKFGKFPESLVAVYISQVLEGLIYLHQQGVIHRDIKGANILTNKDGSVKLADFGVSSRAPVGGGGLGAKDGGGANDNEVVGSPYWMAPEVIEQSGASTASDIWSVGCVVVELLEGKPPYGDLAPMQALWRIVQDESMRVPVGASPVVKDFLYHCFQKDPNLRITAAKLLRHPWMLSAKKHLEPASTGQPRNRDVSLSKATGDSSGLRPSSLRAVTPANGATKLVVRTPSGGETVKARKPGKVYHDEAVQRVQEWNQKLNASPNAAGTLRRLPSITARKVSNARRADVPPSLGIFGLPALPTRSSAESIAASSSSAAAAGPVGLLQKNLHANGVLKRAQEQDGEDWDADFDSDISLSKFHPPVPPVPPISSAPSSAHRKYEAPVVDEPDQSTVRPRQSPALQSRPLPASLESSLSRSTSKIEVEDYSDLASGTSADALEAKLKDLKMRNKARKAIMKPDDIRKAQEIVRRASTISTPSDAHSMPPPPIPSRLVSSTSKRPIFTPSRSSSGQMSQQFVTSPSLPLPQSPKITKSPPGSRQGSLRAKSELSESQRELQKYTEDEEEDYDDMFEQDDKPSAGPSKRQSLQIPKRNTETWSSDQDELADPFAEIDDDFSLGEDDLESQLLRDKRATLCSSVGRIVDLLEPSTPSNQLKEACDELLGIFHGSPDMGLEEHFLSSHGMLAVLELLESRLSRDVAVRLLRVVNMIVVNDVDALESFCLVGGIPVIIPFTSKKHPLDSRLEASIFIQQLTKSALTLQMFISCRGLRILVEMLDEDYSENKTLVLSSLEGIGSVFDLQSPTPRNDFCRMFVREGILDPLSTAMLAILRDTAMQDEGPSARAIQVLLLFCQVAQADGRVRDAFATRMIMSRLLKACELLPRKLLVTAIKSIKHLSTSPQLIEVLQNSNAMDILVSLLGKSIKGTHGNEICSHIFQTIYNMTRLSKARQEEAASSGIIPLLRKVIQNKSPLKQFALPILCDLANAGKVSRRLLWQNNGMKLYLDLLNDPYWRVSALDAILAWMSDETARVEDELLEKAAAECLVKSFVQATAASFEGILDPLLKILRLSTSVTSSISTTPFFHRLAEQLAGSHPAVVKLNLLRLTRVVCDNHPDRETLVSRFELEKIVDRLAKQDEAILVRELAKEIYPSLLFGNETPAYYPRTPSQLGVRDEVMADRTSMGKKVPSMKRSTSDNAPPIPSMVQDEKAEGRNGEKERGAMVRGKTMGVTMSPVKDVNVRELKDVRLGGDEKEGKETVRDTREAKEDAVQRHRRKPSSRGNIRDVWQDENERSRTVRAPAATVSH